VPEALLFAGPSALGLPATAIADAGLQLRPPVRRGDVERLVDSGAAPGVMVICDGVFQSTPAVSHAELCRALDAGWALWGVSSLGAIRAHELRAEGMRGFGYVHAQFGLHDDFTDDELCLLHFPEPPYFAVSEPLVNLRYALQHGGLGIDAAAAAALITALRRLWFGERTVQRMLQLAQHRAGLPAETARRLVAWMQANRIKTLDLAALLQQQPWRDGSGLVGRR
jgi:hypothetical protein